MCCRRPMRKRACARSGRAARFPDALVREELPDSPISLPTRLTRNSSTHDEQTPDSPKSLSSILERRHLSPAGWSAHASLADMRGQWRRGAWRRGERQRRGSFERLHGACATMVPSPTLMPMAATASIHSHGIHSWRDSLVKHSVAAPSQPIGSRRCCITIHMPTRTESEKEQPEPMCK